jgi:hypothetical protein
MDGSATRQRLYEARDEFIVRFNAEIMGGRQAIEIKKAAHALPTTTAEPK